MTLKNALRLKEENLSILLIITIDLTLFGRSFRITRGTKSNPISEMKQIYVSDFEHCPGSDHLVPHSTLELQLLTKQISHPSTWEPEGQSPRTC